MEAKMTRKDGDVMIALPGILSGCITQRPDCEEMENDSIENHIAAMKGHAEK